MFVSCGDTAEGSLEATEKPFNLVALPVHYLVEFLRTRLPGFCGSDLDGITSIVALFPNHIADPIDVVCLVGQHPRGLAAAQLATSHMAVRHWPD